jgi:hypothetical protein
MDPEAPAPRTKLPTFVEQEDPFLKWEFLTLSMRQMLTILGGLVAWGFAKALTSTVLGVISIDVSGLFTGLIWSWLIVAALYLALRTVDGRPYEEYLTLKLLFLTEPRHYVLKHERALPTVEDMEPEFAEPGHSLDYWRF